MRSRIGTALVTPSLLVHERRSARPVRLGTDGSVTVSSPAAGWTGLALEQQALPPMETPDSFMVWHWFSVGAGPGCSGLPAARVIHQRSDGRWRSRALDPDGVVLRPAGAPSSAAWSTPIDTINVAVDPSEVDALGPGGRVELRPHLGPDPLLVSLAHALRAEAVRDTGALVVDGLRLALTAHLVHTYGVSAPRTGRPVRPLTPRELDRVRDLVERDPGADLRLADLAAAVPLSPFHFARAFRAATGTTPAAFVTDIRLRAAVHRLRRSAATVDEIARATGFSDRGHLARHLRRRHGVTPTRMRSLPAPD